MVLTSSTDYLRVYLIATGSSFLCLVIVTLLISNYWVPIPEVAPDVLVVEHTTINNFGSFPDNKLDHNPDHPNLTQVKYKEVNSNYTDKNKSDHKKEVPSLPDHVSPTPQTDDKVAESTSAIEKETSPDKLDHNPDHPNLTQVKYKEVNSNYTDKNKSDHKKEVPSLPDHVSPTPQTDDKVAESTSAIEKETSPDKLDHNQEEPDYTNLTLHEVKPTSTNQNQNVNKKKAPNLPDHTSPTPQTDGKVAESTSTNENAIVSDSPEITPIKINGKPLEKVNANYTHNIYFSVKSSGKNYKDRLFPSMLTWFQLLDKDELTITSDNASAGKPYLDTIKKAGFNVVVSSCIENHSLKGLCCKTGTEFSSYYKALEKHNDNKDRYQWYCHVDDDIYVNVPRLSHVLQQYDPSKPYYIGQYPWKIRRQYDKHPYLPVKEDAKNRIHKRNLTVMADIFQYATGATYCASRALIMKGKHLLNGKDNFIASCQLAGNFDDITVGFIFGAVLGCNLTEVDGIYNQFYKLDDFSKEQISKFLTVSYIMNAKTHQATHTVPLQSNIPGDITKFMAYHCLLYPSVSWCPR